MREATEPETGEATFPEWILSFDPDDEPEEDERITSICDIEAAHRVFYADAVSSADHQAAAAPDTPFEFQIIHRPLTLQNLISLQRLFRDGLARTIGLAFRLSPDPLRWSHKDYIQSPEWKERAEAAKARAFNCCQVCNMSRDQSILDTHHRTYERLGDEWTEDLIVLCRECHELFHSHRKLARPESA